MLTVKDDVVVEQTIRFLEWPSDRVIVLEGLTGGQLLLASPRADLVGENVLPTRDLTALPAGERPRGSDARKAL